jgi:hypothetical protein
MAIFSANQSFCFDSKDGVPRTFRKGTLISDNDPDYKGREALFEPVEDAAARPGLRAAGVTEDASAEPNARRSIGRPRRRGA